VVDWNRETIFKDIIGLYSTTATYLASKEMEIHEKTQNMPILILFHFNYDAHSMFEVALTYPVDMLRFVVN